MTHSSLPLLQNYQQTVSDRQTDRQTPQFMNERAKRDQLEKQQQQTETTPASMIGFCTSRVWKEGRVVYADR